MRTSIFLKISALFLFIGCVKNNEFEAPSVTSQENINLNKFLEEVASGSIELQTISQVKKLYTSGGEPIEVVSDIGIKGYVVSSDREGNFFKEIYIQDAAENPSAGIKVILNLTNSYNKYNIGREVYIRLKDLYIGETNSGDGITTIGGTIKQNDNLEIDVITQNQIENYIFRSEETFSIVPKQVPINGINTNHIGLFVAIENCAFETSIVGESYVNPSDDFDTQRTITSCQGLGFFNMPIETSSFALFANEILPAGGGTIHTLVTKDFRGNNFVLALNTTDDVFLNDERCQPIINEGFSILLEENFENTKIGNLEILNWTNYIAAGTRLWKSYDDEYSLSRAITIGSFFSRNDSTITWLITPKVDLQAINEAFLSFETSNDFGDLSTLEVLISTDWNGDTENINTANWQVLPAKIVDNSAASSNWVHSGYIDISEYKNQVNFAFKYTGSGGENSDGTYELDNIKIEAR